VRPVAPRKAIVPRFTFHKSPKPNPPELRPLDCPPWLGLLTINTLAAADATLIVTKSGGI